MRKIFPFITNVVVAACLITVLVSNADAGSAKRRGTAGAQELLIPVGSVGTALGGSFNAVITGVEAAYWNPAGVADVEGTGEAMISHMNYIAGIDVNYVAIMTKIGGLGAIGATLKSLDFGDIPITTTTAPDGTGEVYSPQFFTLGVLYSRVMTDRIRFGVKMELISEQIMRESALGVAMSAGVQYSTGPDGFKMGVSLRNLGVDMLFNGPDLEQNVVPPGTEPGTRQEPFRVPLAGFELPTQMEIGLAYSPIKTDNLKLTIGGSFLNDNFSFDQYTVGAELELAKMFYLRGSYAIAEDPIENKFVSNHEDFMWGPGFGGGIKLNLGTYAQIHLDYAMRTTKYFDDNQWVSVRFGF